MSKRKNSKQDTTTKVIILLTAILNLVRALIDLISKLTE